MGDSKNGVLIQRKDVYEYIKENFSKSFNNENIDIFNENVKKLIYNTDFDDSQIIEE